MIIKDLYHNIQQVLSKKNINVVVGTIYDLMAQCMEYYRGNVNGFHFYNAKLVDGTNCLVERKTLNMPKKVCEDYSNLLWSKRAEIKLDNEQNTKRLWKVLDSKENSFSINFPKFLEKEYALGAMATVEYKKEGKTVIDYIDGDVVLPYKYTNSYINGIVTVSRSVEEQEDISGTNNKIYYTLLTYHEFSQNVYMKTSELYKSKENNTLGEKIPLTDRYENIEEDEIIFTDYPRFQVWSLPIANNFETGNPLGLSILANHFDKFQNIDTKYDGFDHEFVSGKRRILVDRSAIKKKVTGVDDNDNLIYASYFDTSDDVYVAIEGMENQPVKEIDFSLRGTDYIEAINAELKYLSSGLRLGNDFYSFDKDGLKTATEVISENSDTFRTKEQHQIPIFDALYDMVAAICEMENIKYKEISITFDDSIVQDEDALINRGINLYNAGLISKEKFMSKYLHYEESEIKEELKKIKEENKVIQPEGIDFLGVNNSSQNEEKEDKDEIQN